MSLALLGTIGGLTAVGLYLITSRSLSRIILGFALLGHASVVGLITAGGPPGEAPIAGKTDEAISNPLPQALALTAIVISFGLTLFMLALARRQDELTGDDLVEDDLEDYRIATLSNLAGRLDDVEEMVGASQRADEAGSDDTDSDTGSRADRERGNGAATGEQPHTHPDEHPQDQPREHPRELPDEPAASTATEKDPAG